MLGLQFAPVSPAEVLALLVASGALYLSVKQELRRIRETTTKTLTFDVSALPETPALSVRASFVQPEGHTRYLARLKVDAPLDVWVSRGKPVSKSLGGWVYVFDPDAVRQPGQLSLPLNQPSPDREKLCAYFVLSPIAIGVGAHVEIAIIDQASSKVIAKRTEWIAA